MIKLGTTVRDVITGVEGIVTGRCEYITGCNQVLVQPKAKETGEHVSGLWIDEDRVNETGAALVTLPRRTANGFDLAAPIR